MRVLRLLVVLGLIACATASAQSEPERLRLHGSYLLARYLVPDLAEAWLRDIGYTVSARRTVGKGRVEIAAVRDGEPLVVEIDGSGTASGYHDIVEGEAEVAMTTRPPTAQELDDAWQLGDLHSPDQEWVLGLDGVVVLVSPKNPLREIGMDQLSDVLSGRVTDWSQLGRAPGRIRLHGPMPRSTTSQLASNLVLDGKPVANLVPHARFSQVAAAVAADPDALGLVDLRATRQGTRAVAIRDGSVAVAPDPLAIASEDYPLAQRVHLHTGQLISAIGRSFVLWTLTDKGQAVVARSRFVPVDVRTFSAKASERAPKDYRGYVANADRLGLTIRFGMGLDMLDSRSRQDLLRLGAWLRRPENRGRDLLLMGFAAPQPRAPYQSLALSQERVDFVAGEVLAQGGRVVSVRGFGGQAPISQLDGRFGSYRNLRVEIWVR